MEITCSQFTLRPLELTDAESLATHANNRNIWLNVTHLLPHPYTEQDAKDFYHYLNSKSQLTNFTITVDGKAVGMIGCEPQAGVFAVNAELGYWLAEPFWGRGIMTEAIHKVCEYAFSSFPLERISAHVFGYNKASMQILLKNGFEQEGVMKNAVLKDETLTDLYLFGLLKANRP